MSEVEANRRLAIFTDAMLDYVLEGTREVRQRWHNQKYFTWIEQQGKTVEELNAQLDASYWKKQASLIREIDEKILAERR